MTQLAEGDAKALVELVQPLHRAVKVDRLVVSALPQLGDNALRLAEGIGADQDAAAGIRMKAVEQPVYLGAGLGVPKHGQSEGRLGDEDVARDRHEARAGRVRAALVIARDDDALTLVL